MNLLERTGSNLTKSEISRGKKGSIPEWDGFENKHHHDQVQFQNGLELGLTLKVHPLFDLSIPWSIKVGAIEKIENEREETITRGRGNILGNREWFLTKNDLRRGNLGSNPEWNANRNKHHHDSSKG